MENTVCRCDHILDCDAAMGDALVLPQLVHLDIDTRQVSAFPRNEDDGAAIGRGDDRLQPDVREIGDRKYIHHAPCLVGRIAFQRDAGRAAHGAARAVTAYGIARRHHFDLPGSVCADHFEPGGDRMAARRIDRKVDERAAVMGHDTSGRPSHDIEVEFMHPRLVQDRVRKFRKAGLHIVDPAGADNTLAGLVLRPPEGGFVHPVGFAHDLFGKAESLEHLH
ncbi:hypothetical protein D9M73_135370 [compost metagenome]